MDSFSYISHFSTLVGGAGLAVFLQKGMEHVWGTKTYFGLRCDLVALSPVRPAKFHIVMRPCKDTCFGALEEEFQNVGKSDSIDVFQRILMCQAGVQTPYCCLGEDRSTAYVQWLITASDQHLLHSFQPRRYPRLNRDEVLVEGAYTFRRFRGAGVMTTSMGQLLWIAKNNGAKAAYTYVATDNIPSLRGCAKLGFRLDHVRMSTHRFGFFRTRVSPADERASTVWESAVAYGPRTTG